MATWGKWFTRVGLMVSVLAAVFGALARNWPTCVAGVLALIAFGFNRLVYRYIARHPRGSSADR